MLSACLRSVRPPSLDAQLWRSADARRLPAQQRALGLLLPEETRS